MNDNYTKSNEMDDILRNITVITTPDYEYNGALAEYEDEADYVSYSLKAVRLG